TQAWKETERTIFQVVLDALALTPCNFTFLTTADVLEVYMHQFWDSIHKYDTFYRFRMDKKKKFDLNLEIFRDIFHICPKVHGQNFDEPPIDDVIVSLFIELDHTGDIKSITDVVVDQMHQPWRTFATIINRSLFGKTIGLDKLCLSRAQILWGMYYKKNVDYVELLWEYFTYQIDNKGYKKQEKMYYPLFTKVIIYHFLTKEKTISRRNKIGVTPLKKARKFKKPASPKISTLPASPKEPTRKSKRVKRHAKKSSDAPIACVVIRETPVKSLSKKKEKMIFEKRKGIDLISEVALTKEAQYEEVRKKSLRALVNCIKPGVLDVTEEESTVSEAESRGKDEDDSNNDHESSSEGNDQKRDNGDDNTQSDSENGSDSEHETDENESGFESDQEENKEDVKDDKDEGDEDEGMDSTTYQFDDDVDLRMNEPVTTDEGFIQKEGTDAEMTNVQLGNENLEITLNQVIEDAHVDTIYCSTEKTDVPVTSFSLIRLGI
ncbi:hypothetical protein Tco_0814297, partial [Tanacetum coccineum]